ncbi:MAG: efflux RND transporter periplasmic adaptor subunit [Lentisphaeria bacterium]|nr:efflux RND transporter periplasmic adaptor subunit [Lentisphaeria bacterium]
MKKIIVCILVLCVAALGFYGIRTYRANARYRLAGFAHGNGRLESTEVTIAAKLAGRVEEVYADEGDLVRKGDKLALMQLNILNAQLEQAEAELSLAEAQFKQKESAMRGAESRFKREEQMRSKGATSEQEYENARTHFFSCQADVAAAKAQIQVAKAQIRRVQADIDDSLLISTVRGRVQYRIAEPGEVLNSGDGVLNLVDLTDVYMTFFLPEGISGKVRIGADVRIVLDAIKDTPIPARITFVSSEAQFTPKTVETQEERQKLMFRVKAKIAPELLEQYIEYIKTGLPGEAWVKLDDKAAWPDFLMLKREREQNAR